MYSLKWYHVGTNINSTYTGTKKKKASWNLATKSNLEAEKRYKSDNVPLKKFPSEDIS